MKMSGMADFELVGESAVAMVQPNGFAFGEWAPNARFARLAAESPFCLELKAGLKSELKPREG